MAVTASIIIPCFNSGNHLEETLANAVRAGEETEVIVVDDGSTDDTRSIIDAFGNDVIALFQEHRGVSTARNYGTDLARGTFIQYLDSDDLLVEGSLNERIELLEKTGADVAYCDWQRLVEHEDGRFNLGETICKTLEEIDADPEIATFTGFWAPPAALLYRREVVDRIGGWNESLPIIQDARFLFDAAAAGARFVHVPGIGAYYRVAKGASLSKRGEGVEFVDDVYENVHQVAEQWQKRDALCPLRRAALVGVLDYVAREYFKLGSNRFSDAVQSIREYNGAWRFRYPEVGYFLQRVIGGHAARVCLDAVVRIHRTIQKRQGTVGKDVG